MSDTNTLFLRLSGPMQAWGTGSRLQIRRSDPNPSKSGVLGLILCAMGIPRRAAQQHLIPLVSLAMGVRMDRPGIPDWDYHTAGAKIGIRQAAGGIKYTASTKGPETLLSRREYLLDASFLVALQGDIDVIARAGEALNNPVWPIFLGRKCCVPTEPVLAGEGVFRSIRAALESEPFYTHGAFADGDQADVGAVIEHMQGDAPPEGARLVYDIPRSFDRPRHAARWVVPCRVHPLLAQAPGVSRARGHRARVDYTSEQWKTIRRQRLTVDNDLCVFCKSPAEEVHHVTYEDVGHEMLEDLRSLCRICHDACTQLEYGHDMQATRVDPADPAQREMILRQISTLLTSRRLGRRRAILEASRSVDYLADAPH